MHLKKKIPVINESDSLSAVMYRIPFSVTKVLIFDNGDLYPICPRCGITLERDYAHYCDRCGQCLGWDLIDFAEIIYVSKFFNNRE